MITAVLTGTLDKTYMTKITTCDKERIKLETAVIAEQKGLQSYRSKAKGHNFRLSYLIFLCCQT